MPWRGRAKPGAALILLLLVACGPAAAETLRFGVHAVELPDLPGRCRLTMADPRMAEILTGVDLAQGGQNLILAAWAPCPALEALTQGRIEALPELTVLHTPIRMQQVRLSEQGIAPEAAVAAWAAQFRDSAAIGAGHALGAANLPPDAAPELLGSLGLVLEAPDLAMAGLVQVADPGLDLVSLVAVTVVDEAVLGATLAAERPQDLDEAAARIRGMIDGLAAELRLIRSANAGVTAGE